MDRQRGFPTRRWLVAVSIIVTVACGDRQSGNVLPSHRNMVAALDEVVARTASENVYIGERPVLELRERLDSMGASAAAGERFLLLCQLGEAELNLGRESDAIEHMTEAFEMRAGLEGKIDPGQVWALVFRLGVAHMRLGETENCCRRSSPDSCLLPIRGGGIHEVREPSEQAIRYFSGVLAGMPSNSSLHLASRWLLNIAYMTLGDYPDQVPERWLIPPERLESAEDFPRFVNISEQVGLDTWSLSGAAIVDDFDGDGALDVIVSSWHPEGQLRFYRNSRDGSFEERTVEAGLIGIRGGLNGMQADYDNDGDPDVLILRGAWLGHGGAHPNSLLRNEGNGSFVDVTFDAGLGDVHYPTQTAAWGDYDNDGDLDLYIGNEHFGGVTAPNQLFRNEGDGSFVDVATAAGVTNERFAKAVVWGDFNGDRLPDLYVSNLRGDNRLYRNAGDGTFVDVAPTAGVTAPRWSFPAWFWDFDNDGALDIFVSAYKATVADLAAHLVGPGTDVELARLYRGDGRGGFTEVSASAGLVAPTAPMGSNFGDLDNDGYLDFYLGTGYPDYRELMPNVMYRNVGGSGFSDVSFAGGFAHLQKGHGVVFADLDHDGDQDVFEEMGGAYPGDAFTNALYENPGFDARFLSVKLDGTTSNRSAIGARIRVDVTTADSKRTIYKHVNSGGSFGANPLRQAIGLGAAERIDRLEIYWPTTDRTQIFEDVALDTHLRISEDADRVEIRDLTVYDLGGS